MRSMPPQSVEWYALLRSVYREAQLLHSKRRLELPRPFPDWLTRDTVVPGAGGSDAERVPRRTRRGRCSFAARGPRRRVLTARDRGASLHRSMNAGFLLCEFTAKPLRKSVLELHRPDRKSTRLNSSHL